MTFWLIVLGIVAVVLLLAWRFDRRHGNSVRGDIWRRTGQATSMNLGRGQQAEKNAASGLNKLPFGR